MTFHNPETRLHAAVVRYMRTVCPDCITFHVANGGLRSKETARLMKALGVLPGVFDLIVLAPGPRCFFLECKSEEGRLSEDQEAFKNSLILFGFRYAVVKSLDEVQDFVLQNKLPNRLSEQAARLVAA